MPVSKFNENKYLEIVAGLISLDKSEEDKNTSEIIKIDIIEALEDEIKWAKITLAFLESIKDQLQFICYDNETESAFFVSNEEAKSFINKLSKAYEILLQMLEDNKKEFENMKF